MSNGMRMRNAPANSPAAQADDRDEHEQAIFKTPAKKTTAPDALCATQRARPLPCYYPKTAALKSPDNSPEKFTRINGRLIV